MSKEVLDLLKLGRERIRGGWCQGQNMVVRPEGECYCMAGAIEEGIRQTNIRYVWETVIDARVYLGSTIAKLYPDFSCKSSEWLIITFNDAPERTKEDVLKVYDLAIEKLEGELNGNNRTG